MSDRTANLKPWPKGVSGNPGGRPKKKAITEELERLLEEEAPNGDGKTWAATIAEALLKQAAKGDVRAITERTGLRHSFQLRNDASPRNELCW